MPDALHIIHADAHIAVINKPSGLLSVPGKGEANQDCVPARLRAMIPSATGPLVVHRLDMDTSGLLVLGLTPDSQRSLSRQFEERTVKKLYTAVALGHLPREQGEFTARMRLDPDNRPMQVIDHERGREATTRYRLLGYEPDRSRLELEPLTGRTHQLRLHLVHAGFPIAGDVLYGPQPDTAQAASRLLLHAHFLAFRHPETGAQVEFSAPPPF